MKNYKIIISFIALMALCSCLSKISIFYTPGYITSYYYLERSHVLLLGNVENGELSINFVSYAEKGTSVFDYEKRKQKSDYYKLCCKFNDLYYSQRVEYSCDIGEFHNNVNVYADVVADISIVSDDDWNSEYPRGVLLNDLFGIRAVTIYPYIQSRYEQEEVRTAINLPLSSIYETELCLFVPNKVIKFDRPMPYDTGFYAGGSRFMELYTDRLPENPIQSLHITLTTDEGKTLEYSVELDLR